MGIVWKPVRELNKRTSVLMQNYVESELLHDPINYVVQLAKGSSIFADINTVQNTTKSGIEAEVKVSESFPLALHRTLILAENFN